MSAYIGDDYRKRNIVHFTSDVQNIPGMSGDPIETTTFHSLNPYGNVKDVIVCPVNITASSSTTNFDYILTLNSGQYARAILYDVPSEHYWKFQNKNNLILFLMPHQDGVSAGYTLNIQPGENDDGNNCVYWYNGDYVHYSYDPSVFGWSGYPSYVIALVFENESTNLLSQRTHGPIDISTGGFIINVLRHDGWAEVTSNTYSTAPAFNTVINDLTTKYNASTYTLRDNAYYDGYKSSLNASYKYYDEYSSFSDGTHAMTITFAGYECYLLVWYDDGDRTFKLFVPQGTVYIDPVNIFDYSFVSWTNTYPSGSPSFIYKVVSSIPSSHPNFKIYGYLSVYNYNRTGDLDIRIDNQTVTRGGIPVIGTFSQNFLKFNSISNFNNATVENDSRIVQSIHGPEPYDGGIYIQLPFTPTYGVLSSLTIEVYLHVVGSTPYVFPFHYNGIIQQNQFFRIWYGDLPEIGIESCFLYGQLVGSRLYLDGFINIYFDNASSWDIAEGYINADSTVTPGADPSYVARIDGSIANIVNPIIVN